MSRAVDSFPGLSFGEGGRGTAFSLQILHLFLNLVVPPYPAPTLFLLSGQDYSIAAEGLITFTPGTHRQQSVNILLLQEKLVEVNESFIIMLSSDDSQVLTPMQNSQLLIIDNDGMNGASNWVGEVTTWVLSYYPISVM